MPVMQYVSVVQHMRFERFIPLSQVVQLVPQKVPIKNGTVRHQDERCHSFYNVMD